MKIFTLFGALIFLVVAAAHAYRLYTGMAVAVGGHVVPMSASWAGAAVAAILGIGMLVEARR
jgi:hypothetical protein